MKLAVNADKTSTMATNPNVSMSHDLVPKSPRMRVALLFLFAAVDLSFGNGDDGSGTTPRMLLPIAANRLLSGMPTIRPQGGHQDFYRYGFIKFPKNQLGANARNLP